MNHSLTCEHLVVRSRKWLFSDAGALTERVIRGGFWLLLSDALAQGVGIIKIVLIARLLAPADLGLFGIAMVVQTFVESFTDTGIMAALIQKRGDVRPYLDTAWTLQMLRGTVVCLLLVLIAPLGGRFFGIPQAAPIIRCVGVTTLLWGMVNPAVIYLRRDLRFRVDVAWRFSGVLASLAVAVPAAFYFRSAWALMWAFVADRAGQLIASYCVHPYRPRFRLRWRESRELIGFGRWISISNMIAFVENQADSVLVGRYFGATSLGFYQVAVNFTGFFTRVRAHVGGVLFPALSKLECDHSRRRALNLTLEALSSALLPLALFVTVWAEPLVELVLGARWLPAAAILKITTWAAVARVLSAGTGPLLMSIGRPRTLVETQAVKVVLFAVLVYPCMRNWAAIGIAGAVAISCAVSTGLQVLLAARAVHTRLADLLRTQTGAALACAPLATAFAAAGSPMVRLLFTIIALAVYAVVLWRIASRLFQGAASVQSSEANYSQMNPQPQAGFSA